jgi:hypothetical protein
VAWARSRQTAHFDPAAGERHAASPMLRASKLLRWRMTTETVDQVRRRGTWRRIGGQRRCRLEMAQLLEEIGKP